MSSIDHIGEHVDKRSTEQSIFQDRAMKALPILEYVEESVPTYLRVNICK